MTRIKVGTLRMKPKLLTTANHDIKSWLIVECVFLTQMKLLLSRNLNTKEISSSLGLGLLGGLIGCVENLVIMGQSIGIQMT